MLRSRADRPRAGHPTAATTLAAALLALAAAAPPAAALDVTAPDWSVNGTKLYGDLGWCVATAGDVNGDGYSDLLVTEPFGDPDYLGAAYLYYGSPTGPSTTADWTSSGAAGGDEYGYSAATGGDINGDGYDDFVIGIRSSDVTTTNGGAIEVWYGSAGGPQAGPVIAPSFGSARFGHSVAFAGDVNGDGYHDVVVGAPNWSGTGSAWVYVGGAAGLFQNPTRILTGAQAGMELGASVAGAGDVNADGYDDVLVGAPRNDSLLQTDNGRAFLYLGNSSGVDAVSQWSALGIGTDTFFGRSVAPAGDVNGDGYADVLVGEPGWDNGQTDEGAMHVYLGSSVGLASGVPPWLTLESNVADAQLGYSVAVAGDVNGDGYPDLVGGGPFSGVTQQGWIGVWEGALSGPEVMSQGTLIGAGFLGYSVAPAGDVNGDGYGDIAVGAPLSDFSGTDNGWAGLYFGGGELPIQVGSQRLQGFATSTEASIACAGDVNGDGLDDLLVGEPNYQQAGRAVIHFGRTDSLSGAADWEYLVAAAGDELGYSVSSAGDVNGDGFADVVLGAPGANQALVFHGSPSGPSATPDAVLTGTGEFGRSVSFAGDFDADGYADVAVGAPDHVTAGDAIGAVFVWGGSPTGVDTAAPLESIDQLADAGSRMGESVAGVGDWNGDGFDDVAIGLPRSDFLLPDAGMVWICAGNDEPGWNSWVVYGDFVAGSGFGAGVSAAGDVDGDGLADVLIGSRLPEDPDDGTVWLLKGALPGSTYTAVRLPNPTPSTGGAFGSAVAGAGDVNGDGLSDLVAGDPGAGIGAMAIWTGPDPETQATPWQATWAAAFGDAVGGAGDLNGDGFADVAVWSASFQEIDIFYGGGHRYREDHSLPRPHPRQLRVTGVPVALGGLAEPTIVRLQSNTSSPAGRADVRMEIQLAEVDQPFGPSQLTGWQDPGAVSAGRPTALQGLEPTPLIPETDYRWRMRIRSRHPFFPQGRWMSNQPAVPTLKHFRTAVHPATGVAIVGSETAADGGIRWIGPNPFRTSSVIDFAVPRPGPVRLDVVDVTGRRVATLVDESVEAGSHRAMWNGRDEGGTPVAAGVYFARLQAGGEVATRKIVRLR